MYFQLFALQTVGFVSFYYNFNKNITIKIF